MGLFDYFKKKTPIPEISQVCQSNGHIITMTFECRFGTTETTEAELGNNIKSAFPSANGLYPHELLILNKAEKYKLNQRYYHSFWEYSYGIKNKNVRTILNTLLKNDFLAIASVESSLKNAIVTELKAELKSNNLKVSGRKAELVTRLLDGVPETQLEKAFPDRYYALTPKGKQELSDNPYINYIDKKSFCDLDIWEANILLHQNPGFSISDMSWRKFSKERQEHFINHNFAWYRYVTLNMALQLIDEGRLEAALKQLLEVFYWDLSGTGNSFNIDYMGLTIEYFFKDVEFETILSHDVLSPTLSTIRTLGFTEHKLKEFYFAKVDKFNTPFHLFTKEECFEIILYGINSSIYNENYNPDNNDDTNIKQIYKDAERRFKEKYKLS